jgi:N6-L-threonylcarbamoyladenine synthase
MSEINQFPPARILGIESSCDETAAAIVEDGHRVLSNVVSTQTELHAKYGGIFPEVASREHVKTIYTVVEEALMKAHMSLDDVDAIAVTQGPGLPGSLVVGVNMAKGLAIGSGKPLIGINHLEGHLYSAWLEDKTLEEPPTKPQFPLLALIVSGGHTELILMTDHLTYKRLGGTLDDAAGEAFDKVGRLLKLPYPGGPSIEATSIAGDAKAFAFPRSWLKDTWNFSFSGLKTSVLHQVRKIRQEFGNGPDDESVPLPISDLAASFQQAVVEVLVTKTRFAAQEFAVKEILVAGGVSANKELRKQIQLNVPGIVHLPAAKYCTDNAAMIATAGYYRYINNYFSDLSMDVMPSWPLAVEEQTE